MSNQTWNLTDKVYQYLQDVSIREPDVLRRLREETAKDKASGMQISPEQGQLMGLLTRLLGARKTLEVGVFTGYSSLSVALQLPADGKIIACDVNEQWTQMARRYWEEAGVAAKIDLRLKPALETLDELLGEKGNEGTFDFAFIDADKENYLNYYERCLKLLRPGGLVAVDNVLWGGSVADEDNQERSTKAIRALNRHLKTDERVFLSLVPIADGLTLALKN